MRVCPKCGKVIKYSGQKCHECLQRTLDGPEPTEEELDRTIEEQRTCLPDWWYEPDPEGDV